MELDAERRPLIELIFRLALRGRTTGQIAKSLNDAGWLTKQIQKRRPPRPFDLGRVHEILKNPRYAGLSVRAGEVMARDCWPAYITERQHLRILRQLQSAQRERRRHREAYLLARIARCGRCDSPLHTLTGNLRPDGNYARRYACASHLRLRGRAQCTARPIDAHTAEAMVIASIGVLLLNAPADHEPQSGQREDGAIAGVASARARLRQAVLRGAESEVDSAIESLFEEVHPHIALIRDGAISQRRARELKDAERLNRWIERESEGRGETTRSECGALSRMLRGWFAEVTLLVDEESVTITACRRSGAGAPPEPTQVVIDRAAWTRRARRARRQMISYGCWDDVEIIGALQAWADTHGRSPTPIDWLVCEAHHPETRTLEHHFGSWERGLERAGLEPSSPVIRRRPWSASASIQALQDWTAMRGRPPQSMEWFHANPEHPCSTTVRKRFGSWDRALAAANLQPGAPPARSSKHWSREETVEALKDWSAANGRLPEGVDWVRASDTHPTTITVRKRFGTWKKALEAAGLG
jgi:hypothetical protein